MTSQTADLDIAAIRQRADNATPGPWTLMTDSCDCGGDWGCRHGEFPFALRLPTHTVSNQNRPCDPGDSLDSYRHNASEFGDLTMADGEFIAAARSDVPALLAEVERLRRFIEWVARLDQYDPEPHEDAARQHITKEQIAAAAREALGRDSGTEGPSHGK